MTNNNDSVEPNPSDQNSLTEGASKVKSQRSADEAPLKPDVSVQKFLISSTCRFTGEFQADGFLLTHAWPGMRDSNAHVRWTEGPAARSAFMLVFRTDYSKDFDGIVIPNYEYMGNIICSYLTVLFGKRFDFHGAVESSGFFSLPNLNVFNTLCNSNMPQNNHKPRANCGVPLVLNEVQRLMPLLFGEPGESEKGVAFQGSAKFYHQALQTAEVDVEVAYLHLITAGEILSGAVEVPEDCLIDAELQDALNRIEAEMNNGTRTARIVRSRLRSVKRRFVVALDGLVDATFFDISESKTPFSQFKMDDFESVLGAAYNLRSHYVHTGKSFGNWVKSNRDNGDIQVGHPIVDDKDFGRILALAPTFSGLERTIRYSLLKFAEQMGVDLSIKEGPSAG